MSARTHKAKTVMLWILVTGSRLGQRRRHTHDRWFHAAAGRRRRNPPARLTRPDAQDRCHALRVRSRPTALGLVLSRWAKAKSACPTPMLARAAPNSTPMALARRRNRQPRSRDRAHPSRQPPRRDRPDRHKVARQPARRATLGASTSDPGRPPCIAVAHGHCWTKFDRLRRHAVPTAPALSNGVDPDGHWCQ
jgi:hypothetical protein